MTLQTLANAALILILVGWIGIRQLTWRPILVGRMWRLPIVFAAIGLFALSGSHGASSVTAVDAALLSLELVVSLGVGAAMGALATIRPLSSGDGAPDAPRFESRTGWVGLALWFVFIGVRVGIDVWAGALGSHLAASTGVIFVMVAANRVARTAVIGLRVSRLATVAPVPAGAR
ncbi:hypothetical protein [Lacisediminihabitans profunda]|uniref:DUF1453 family protein n=1 Tax=Lacisediminihabitans profunda TaxID=2594790 RepID=A0A5C8UN90_9MICO|nr:hypothetical protein [Lacisediminihabitans profunda]TXN29693.1 hypothetical protein FVP33_11100 [Lacisediminihabitans profunda]